MAEILRLISFIPDHKIPFSLHQSFTVFRLQQIKRCRGFPFAAYRTEEKITYS
jgi:hypothetical protein